MITIDREGRNALREFEQTKKDDFSKWLKEVFMPENGLKAKRVKKKVERDCIRVAS